MAWKPAILWTNAAFVTIGRAEDALLTNQIMLGMIFYVSLLYLFYVIFMLFCMLLTLLTQRSFWLIQIVLQNRSVNSAQCNSTQYIQCDAVQCNTTNKINHCHLGTLSEPDVKNPTFYERRTRSHFPAVCHKYSQIIQNERSGICKKKRKNDDCQLHHRGNWATQGVELPNFWTPPTLSIFSPE